MTQATKRCPSCGHELPVAKFSKKSSTNDGLCPHCKDCRAAYDRSYYEKRRAADPVGVWAHRATANARFRAKAAGVPFSIDEAFIHTLASEVCPVLGIQMEYAVSGDAAHNSPSVDRIIPMFGYVPGNVKVISHLANTIKSNATAAQIQLVANYLRQEELSRGN